MAQTPPQAYLKYGVPQNHLKKTSLLVKVKHNLTASHSPSIADTVSKKTNNAIPDLKNRAATDRMFPCRLNARSPGAPSTRRSSRAWF